VAAAVAAIALIACWGALQPVRAAHAESAAYDRLERGEFVAAASIARIAHERDPLAVDPLFDIATIEQARGNTRAAGRALGQAVELEPATAEVWRRLGEFRLNVLHDADGARRAFQAALFLDPVAPENKTQVILAARAARGG
jgi:tetratricopeptide (TPR) repeat protein